MDSENINLLLDKYWKCETSVEEEQQLQAFFRQHAVPGQLKETAALFRFFDEQKAKQLADVSFDRGVINKIQAPARKKIATLVFNAMRIAAGIIVLMVAVWLVRMEVRESVPAEMADTYDDPQLAFEETKKALMMISKSFSTAEEQAKKINLFNEAQQNIRKEGTKAEL